MIGIDVIDYDGYELGIFLFPSVPRVGEMVSIDKEIVREVVKVMYEVSASARVNPAFIPTIKVFLK